MVLFLLMWRRRSNTKTDRPAMRAASSPPTTPAAIMEKPDALKDRRKQIYISKTETKFEKERWGGQDNVIIFSMTDFTASTHLIFRQPARPGPVHLENKATLALWLRNTIRLMEDFQTIAHKITYTHTHWYIRMFYHILLVLRSTPVSLKYSPVQR